MKIKLNLIDDINAFYKTCVSIFEENIFISQGKQVISAKSLLGIYSLNLSDPIEVHIDTDNKNTKEDFYKYISKWKVED